MVSTTKTNSYRCIDGVIWPAGPHEQVGQLDVAGKNVISVQTKAARLDSHVIGQAFFSQRLLRDHGKARSVRTVALCTADDAVLRPIAEGLGVEVVVLEKDGRGGTSLPPNPMWVERWHKEIGRGTLYMNLRVVRRAHNRGHRSVYAVIDLDGPYRPGEPESGRRGADLAGRNLVALTTTTGRPGMYSVGEALVNRILLKRCGGANSVRSIVLCGQPDSVMEPMAAEREIELRVMAPTQ